MKKIVLLGVFGTALLAACQIYPAPSSAKVTTIELGIGNNLAAQMGGVSYQTDTGITFTPLPTVICDDIQSNLRYIYRRFTVANNTGSTLTNLQLHAYKKTGSANNTALKSITNFGGVTADATVAQPRHGIGAACGTAPFVPTADYADLQLYTDTEITSRTTLAGTNLLSGEDLLGYGYLVRQRSPQTNADSDSRTIANGESGFVTIALKIPKETGNTYNFNMTFLLFTDISGTKELVQTPEDQFAGTTAGLTQAQLTADGAARVSVLGGAACGLSGSNRFQGKVIIAKNLSTATTITDSELNAPTITTTVTSNLDTGAGSLRQAIADAAAGDTICFTQNIILTSAELSIAKNLTILAGEAVSISGNNARRVLNISSGNTINLYGFTVKQGRILPVSVLILTGSGGGILNAGTLNLFGMTISNNYVENTSIATGGGIYTTGDITARFTQIKNNTAQGAYSGDGQGGGVYLSNKTLTLVASSISSNTASGGRGAPGIDGVIDPRSGDCIIPPTKGSNGGNAFGGGVYKAGPNSIIVGSGLVTGNTASGGTGGMSGNSFGGLCQRPRIESSNGTALGSNIY
jgi:hypothetical protein